MTSTLCRKEHDPQFVTKTQLTRSIYSYLN